jgi:amino acid transporter
MLIYSSLFGIIINCAGTPDQNYIGFTYWSNPGAFNNGIKGFCNVLLNAMFAFGGIELVGIAAAETANPRKALPMAMKQVFWRICIFYLSTILLIGIIVRHNDPRLLQGANSADANASPLVIAFEQAGLQVFPSIINAVVLVSVLSVGNSAVFGSSRTLAALGALQHGPKVLAYIDRKGRPLVAISLAALFSLLAYLADLPNRDTILHWLVEVSGLCSVFTWATICLCHIQFRKAWLAQGFGEKELPYRSYLGVTGSYVGLTLNIGMVAVQVWIAFSPIGHESMRFTDLARNAALKTMGGVLILMLYAIHKLVHGTTCTRSRNVDLDTGRRDYNVNVGLQETRDRDRRASWPKWKRIYKVLC